MEVDVCSRDVIVLVQCSCVDVVAVIGPAVLVVPGFVGGRDVAKLGAGEGVGTGAVRTAFDDVVIAGAGANWVVVPGAGAGLGAGESTPCCDDEVVVPGAGVKLVVVTVSVIVA